MPDRRIEGCRVSFPLGEGGGEMLFDILFTAELEDGEYALLEQSEDGNGLIIAEIREENGDFSFLLSSDPGIRDQMISLYAARDILRQQEE